MTRLNLDPLTGLLASEPMLAAASAAEVPRGSAGSFDQHLQWARQTIGPEATAPPSVAEPGSPPRAESNPIDRPSTPQSAATSEPEDARGPRETAQDREDPREREGPQDAAAPPAETAAAAASASRPAESGVVGGDQAQDGPGEDAPGEAAQRKAAASKRPQPAAGQRSKEDGAGEAAQRKASSSKPQPAAGQRSKENGAGGATDGKATSAEMQQPSGKQAGRQVQPHAESSSIQVGPPAKETAQAPAAAAAVLQPDATEAKSKDKKGAPAVQPPDPLGAAAAAGNPADPAAGESAANASLSPDLKGPKALAAVPQAQAAETTPRRSSRQAARSAAEGRTAAQEPEAASDGDTRTGAEQKPVEPRVSVSPETAAVTAQGLKDAAEPPAAKAAGDPGWVQAAGEKRSQPGAAAAVTLSGPETPGAEQADRVRFVQRVARAFEAAADRGGTLRLRLHPPELGGIRLELSLRRGAMTARLETETEAARTMLLDNLPALRQRLAEHQIRVERFEVEWTGQSAGDLSQQADRQSRWQESGGRYVPPHGVRPAQAPSASAPVRPPLRPGQGAGFDVII